ncbi:unnamed protein product [Peniophora sp. CBMAI 1063]|nr:unnamed protein product [Peniophora sp. CBMAI 1063]
MPPPSVQDVDTLDYGMNDYEEELQTKLDREKERSRSLQAQVDVLMARLANADGHDARRFDSPVGDDQWAHVHGARLYNAPPASEASLPSLASDPEYIPKAEHDTALARANEQVRFLNTKREQSQVDAKEMQKQNDSLRVALVNRGEELAAYKADYRNLRELLEDPHRQAELSARASERFEHFFNEALGPSAVAHPVLTEAPSFVSYSGGQFMSDEAKAICGIFAMFSTREQTMFFPETHAARAVVVRSTHKFIKKDDTASGHWERFENRADFSQGKIRQVFWRTGPVNYKYMGTYRCVFQSEMNLSQVPAFPNFDPHSIIRNAVKQHEKVSPLITSQVESLFQTSAIRVNCWALERIGYSTRLEDALFLPGIQSNAPPLPVVNDPSPSRAQYPQRSSPTFGQGSARAPAPYTKRPRGNESYHPRHDTDKGRSYQNNRFR